MAEPNPSGPGQADSNEQFCDFCERWLPANRVKTKDGTNICGGCEALERGYYK